MIIVGIIIVTGCKKVGRLENLFTHAINKPQRYILSKNGYNFHYLTFIEKETQSGNCYFGKDVSLLTLSTIKRWANQGFGNFTPPPRRNAFINKIEAVINQIEKGAYNAAGNKMANDIIPFMELSVTGPFRNTFGLLLESSLIGMIQAEDTIEVDISYESLFNANPYSLQEIHAIICKPGAFVCEVIVPMPSLEDSLQTLSCALAMGLEDRENREILHKYLTNSPYNEHKIFLKDYINEIRSDGNPIVTTMSISSGYTTDYLEGLTQNHPEIAIHFPDTSHYVEWTNSYKTCVPWVTYVPPFMSDTEVTRLTGFVYNGENTFIDGKTPPDYPVLIITPEPPESISETEIPAELPEVSGERGNSRILVRVMHIYKKCEPWWLGAMEIYTAVFHENIYWSNVVPYYNQHKELRGCPGVTTKDLRGVDKRCKRYRIYGKPSPTCGNPDKRGKSAYNYYIPPSGLGRYDMVVLEDDGWGDEDDWLGRVSITKVWYGGGCSSCNPAPCLPLITEPGGRYKTKVYYYYNWVP